MVGALLRRVSFCAPLSVMLQRFFAQAAVCLLVSQAASPRKISTPSRFVLLLGALFGRLAHGYEACARGPRERLAQHLCALLGSHRCKGCNPARSETCEGRRRVVVAAGTMVRVLSLLLPGAAAFMAPAPAPAPLTRQFLFGGKKEGGGGGALGNVRY